MSCTATRGRPLERTITRPASPSLGGTTSRSKLPDQRQALIVAKVGAACCTPFLGRLDDIGQDGMELVRDIREIYDNYGFTTQLLAASLRHPNHVLEAAEAGTTRCAGGADVGTMPYPVFQKLWKHPMTDIGLERFLADWKKTQK